MIIKVVTVVLQACHIGDRTVLGVRRVCRCREVAVELWVFTYGSISSRSNSFRNNSNKN